MNYTRDRLIEAAHRLRYHADRATQSPWRVGGAQYSALVANQPHPARPNVAAGGWGWDDAYGGCLIGESMMTGDLMYMATVQPSVAYAVADVLNAAAGTDQLSFLDMADAVNRLAALIIAVANPPAVGGA